MGGNLRKCRILLWKELRFLLGNVANLIFTMGMPMGLLFIAIFSVTYKSKTMPEKLFPPFCALKFSDANCPFIDEQMLTKKSDKSPESRNILYSPQTKDTENVMSFFKPMFGDVIGCNDSSKLENYYIENYQKVYAAIAFDNRASNLMDEKVLRVSIRFPKLLRHSNKDKKWHIGDISPLLESVGPREYDIDTGGYPSYHQEGFLNLQQRLVSSFVLAKNGFTYPMDSTKYTQWASGNELPNVFMRRYPHSSWTTYDHLFSFGVSLRNAFSVIMLMTPVLELQSILKEKEQQMKDFMKVLGLQKWLYYLAKFVFSMTIYIIFSAVLVLVLHLVPSKPLLPNTNYVIIFLLLVVMCCAGVTFAYVLSTIFKTAIMGVIGCSVICFVLILLIPPVPKLTFSNWWQCFSFIPAAIYGVTITIKKEERSTGISWQDVWQLRSPNGEMNMGLIFLMLFVDTIIHILLTFYLETVVSSEYTNGQPFYFLCTKKYWFGADEDEDMDEYNTGQSRNDGDNHEREPTSKRIGVEIKNLRKVFGNFVAVKNLSMNMYQDEITVLLGHNGAGKTTTMRMLTGLLSPTSGKILIGGFNVDTDFDEIRNTIGFCPQHDIFFDTLTVTDNIYFFSMIRGKSKKEAVNDVEKFVRLLKMEEFKNKMVKKLSGGQKRRLSIAMAFCGDAKYIVLDEPTAGVDPTIRREIWDLLFSVREGSTILVSTHFMDEADVLADRVGIMFEGELKCSGSPLFLKKKFGSGYTLVIEKSPYCNVYQLTSALKRIIPDVEVTSNSGRDVTYLLDQRNSSKYEALLSFLESNSRSLGVNSYGLILTTLEEVFLKIGQYDDGANTGSRANVAVSASANMYDTESISCCHLVMLQIKAMFMKRIYAFKYSWKIYFAYMVFALAMVVFPMIMTLISGGTHLMTLNFDGFEKTVVLIEKNADSDYASNYENLVKQLGGRIKCTINIEKCMQNLTKTSPGQAEEIYFGNSFVNAKGTTTITSYFNNNPFHTPGIALSMTLNAIYRKLVKCNDCSIVFNNEPLPYSPDEKDEGVKNELSMSTFNSLVMPLVMMATYYCIYINLENTSKAKHLQETMGVKVYVFWLCSIFIDSFLHIIIVIVVIIPIYFYVDGITGEDIGVLILLMWSFGTSTLPLIYFIATLFRQITNAIQAVIIIYMFINFGYVMVDFFNLRSKYEYILKWMIVIPFYNIMDAVDRFSTVFLMRNMKSFAFNEDRGNIFSYFNEDLGISKHLFWLWMIFLIFLAILFLRDYGMLRMVCYCIPFSIYPSGKSDEEEEDNDVTEEKRKIKETSSTDLREQYVIVVKNLWKRYTTFSVKGLTFGIPRNECFGLLGSNGAGKSTTFRMLSGDVFISSGTALMNGYSMKWEMKNAIKNIGYCPQFDALLDNLTVRENIVFFTTLRGISEDMDVIVNSIAQDYGLEKYINTIVKRLSGGNRRKLSVAVATIGDPAIILLDEPSTGIDPGARHKLWVAINNARDSGKSIVLTSHSMEECEALCTRVVVMMAGEFKCIGSIQHLKNKFAKGYNVTLKLRKVGQYVDEHPDLPRIESFMNRTFPGSKLTEKHQGIVVYSLDDPRIPCSRIFGILENAKRDINIDDYAVTQNKLEQVFLTITKEN